MKSRVYSPAGRLRTIAQALTAIESVYPRRTEVSVIPIVDVLRLLVQRPLILSFFRRSSSQQAPLYSTLHDPEYEPGFLASVRDTADLCERLVPVPPANSYGLLLSLVSVRGIAHLSRADIAAKAYEALFAVLLSGGIHRSARVLESIESELNLLERGESTLWSIKPAEELGPELDGEAVARLLGPIRGALDDAFGDMPYAPLLAGATPEGIDLPNLFAVIRSRPTDEKRRGVFNYTAQLLCSSTQRSALEALYSGDAVEKLEHPLEAKARSIADAVYASGNVEFSPDPAGSGRDTEGRRLTTSGERDRRALERSLYRRFDHRVRGRPTPFFVPVHTNGTPWILLFTITPRHLNPEERWAHHYHFYRDVALPIAERLRGATRQAYLEQIASGLRSAFSLQDAGLFVDYLTREWGALSRIYPYRRLAIHSSAARDADLVLPNRQSFRLEQESATAFGSQVPYRLLGLDEVRSACRTAFERQLQEWAHAQAASARQWLYQDHTMRMYLPVQELELLTGMVEEAGGSTLQRLIEDAYFSCQILNAALDIASAGLQGARRGRPEGLASVKTVLDLIQWLCARSRSSGAQPRLVVSPGAPDRELLEGELSPAFTVLLNIWTNAAQYSSGYSTFFVQVHDRLEFLRVRVLNRRRHPARVEIGGRVLKAGASLQRPRGLDIVKECLEELGWPPAVRRETERKVLVELSIPKR